MRTLLLLVVIASTGAGAATVRADNSPRYAVSDDTVIVRGAAGASWGTERGVAEPAARTLGGSLHAGVLVNHALLAADLGVTGARVGEQTGFAVLPSAGIKLKFLSTAANMGFTYVHAGVRAQGVAGSTALLGGVGVRDFITYDVTAPWGFVFEWHAFAGYRLAGDAPAGLSLDGGAAVGVAHAEERADNYTVLLGWKRDRLRAGEHDLVSDGIYLSASHQWR